MQLNPSAIDGAAHILNVAEAPLIFESAGRVFRADSCEALKAAQRAGSIELTGWARGSYPGSPMPDGTLEGLRSVGAWNAARRQDWGLGEHCNEGVELTCCLRGGVDIAVDGVQHYLNPGEVMVTAPWRPHSVGVPVVTASRIAWFILDVGVRRPNQSWNWPAWVLLSDTEKARIAKAIQNSDRFVWADPELTQAFGEIDQILHDRNDLLEYESAMKVALNMGLIKLSRLMESQGASGIVLHDTTHETVRRFLKRIDEHLSYPWKVEEMARQCGVSRCVFISACQEVTNLSPHQFLLQRRISRASQMLREEAQSSLTEIAMACGFCSSAHFSYAFRREVGTTPSNFRSGKQHQ